MSANIDHLKEQVDVLRKDIDSRLISSTNSDVIYKIMRTKIIFPSQ